MVIKIISFSDTGFALGKRLKELLAGNGCQASIERSGQNGISVMKWTTEHFHCCDALIFIGAAGIAVRAIAPHIKSKLSDPAVLVIDDAAQYVIPILSGHLGGANELAYKIANDLGACPVITTATDIYKVFAVDNWAKKLGMAIINPSQIQKVSSRVLSGQEIIISSPFEFSGTLPDEIRICKKGGDVVADIYRQDTDALILVPRIVSLGIGCRKNTPFHEINAAFEIFCSRQGIYPQAVCGVFSIDLKKDEAGILEFCDSRGLPYTCFSAQELSQAEGNFTSSGFVMEVTGTDNVCERSAVLGSMGELIAAKMTFGGITMAAAINKFTLYF